MNFKGIPTDELKKEIRRREGIQWLEREIDWVTSVEIAVEKLRAAKEVALAKVHALERGGDFEGKFPVVPELTEAIEGVYNAYHERY